MDINELNEKEAELAAALKPRQKKFVEEYEKDGNGTQAAIRAGYPETSAATQASRLLRNDKVLAYRRVRASIAFQTAGISKDSLMNDLIEIKERCMQAKPVMQWDYSKHCFVPTGEWQFDAKDAAKAIEMLTDMIGASAPTEVKVTGDPLMTMTIEKRESIIREMIEKFGKAKTDEE